MTLENGARVRVNVRTEVNNDKIKYETRNGREKIIVPSATLPDNVIMNDIMYPAEEIEKGFNSLEGTPAPLGHPTLNGSFLPAANTEAFIRFGIGAANENVRREGGRVFMDKVIDVEFAKQSDRGRRVLNAIEKGEPIHTSTGLMCMLHDAGDTGGKYSHVASDMEFDHDAILLDEPGAATPEQGVGMMVNKEGKELTVINSTLDESVERELTWMAEQVVHMMDREARKPLVQEVVEALKSMFPTFASNSSTQTGESQMDDDTKKGLDALNTKIDALPDQLAEAIGKTLGETMTNAMKPLVDAQNAANERAEAEAATARNAKIDKLVEAKIFTNADEAKDMNDAALDKMLTLNEDKSKDKGPRKAAAPLNSASMTEGGGRRSFTPPTAPASS